MSRSPYQTSNETAEIPNPAAATRGQVWLASALTVTIVSVVVLIMFLTRLGWQIIDSISPFVLDNFGIHIVSDRSPVGALLLTVVVFIPCIVLTLITFMCLMRILRGRKTV